MLLTKYTTDPIEHSQTRDFDARRLHMQNDSDEMSNEIFSRRHVAQQCRCNFRRNFSVIVGVCWSFQV